MQPNNGDSNGNLYSTFNIDLESKRGKVRVSEQTKTAFTDADDADFSGYAAAITSYGGDYFAVSDKAFNTSTSTPTTGWSEASTTGSEPNSGNTIMDAVVFDSLLLVSESTDIKSWNDTTWASWWQGTAGQSALTIGTRHLMKVGADGNLYITETANKVFRVTPTGTVTKTGNGTLDFSATALEITCMEPTSNRMWLGTANSGEGECVIIEWDMSPNASTANKLHRIGNVAVRCIAVFNDTPIAILQSGRVLYFNGASFVEYPGVRFPVKDNVLLDEDFIHPNGWAIIDNQPHFLVTGRINGSSSYIGTALSNWIMPAGIYCLDPEIGLYHRFALGSGATSQDDYGMSGIARVGALYALNSTDTKFLCSYEYYLTNGTSQRSVLAYHDLSNSRPGRGFIVTPYLEAYRETWATVEQFHSKLASGEKMKVYYRRSTADTVTLQGAWATTTQFNTVVTGTGIEVGDLALVKTGKGAGQLIRISSVTESAATTSIELEEANTFATAADVAVIEVLPFKYMGAVDNTTRDFHKFNVPATMKARKTQFLLEFRQAAENRMEMDYCIINT